MIRRFLASRGARKFRRSRLAVAALAVIGLYGALAASIILAGLITLDDAERRIGPDSVPGWLEARSPEKRLRDCAFYLDHLDRALAQRDVPAALARLPFGGRAPFTTDADLLRERVDEAYVTLDELSEADDLDDDPALLPRLAEVEAQTAALLAPLTGAARWVDPLVRALGTDRQGRSILLRSLYSAKVAVQVGLIVAGISVITGAVLGAAAAFLGGWVDHAVVWLYSTLSSMPELVLLAVLVYMFSGSVFDDVSRPALSLVPVYAAMCMTFWIGTCRVIRGEAMKIKELEYIQAARALGLSRAAVLVRHVLPNTLHLMFINFSLLFIAAIKFEVVLSFLGLGVKVGPSWGRMIAESEPEVINGFFWQIGAATAFMFILVLAFNIVSDALQDAFDPKHVG